MIGVSIDKLKLIILLISIISLAACIPNPSKVRKIVELTEHQKLHDKYELQFEKCFDSKKTDLTFVGLSEKPAITIYLDLNPESKSTDWQESLLCFQKRLPKIGLNYQDIAISDGRGPDFRYSSKCVGRYDKAFKLFNRNLEQIKENRIDDLCSTLADKQVKSKSVKDLFAYITVTDLKDTELFAYPSDDIFGDNRIIFKLEASKNTTLYFSYIMHEEQVFLTSIDLNNISSSIGFSNLFGKIKK